MGVSRVVVVLIVVFRVVSVCWWFRFREECVRGVFVFVRCVGFRFVGV